jgi:hypothetical protein
MAAQKVIHPYASTEYADAFQPLEPIWLPNARTHVLRRPIPETQLFDAMGCYPLCVFAASDDLESDFELLADRGVVSLVLVTDCLTQPDESFLHRHFDLCRPYKTHLLFDATQTNANYSKHHCKRVRGARKKCETRVVKLGDYLSDWVSCYETLVKRKGITGMQNFSRDYFERIAEMPQATTIAAFADNAFVSAYIWMSDGRGAYGHLSASTDIGYKLESAYACYDHAIQLFRDDHVIDMGGGTGAAPGKTDGLFEFKKGFANTEKSNYLCGKIVDRDAYQALSKVRSDGAATSFFPAYRAPLGI